MNNEYSSLQELIIKGEELRRENEKQTFALVAIKPSYYVNGNATITGILVNGAGEKLPVNMYLAPLVDYFNNNEQSLETSSDEEQVFKQLMATGNINNPETSSQVKVESKEETLARFDQEVSNGLMDQAPLNENQDTKMLSIEELHASIKPSVDINLDSSSDDAKEAEFKEDMMKASNMNAEERKDQIEQRVTEYNSYGYQEDDDEDEELDGD